MRKINITTSIRTKLIFLFVVQIFIVLGFTGFYLNWHIRNLLEYELSEKLELAASLISSQMDTQLLMSLEAGEENTRTYHNLQSRLQEIKNATEVRRIYIANRRNLVLVDTKSGVAIGTQVLRLELDSVELNRVWNGTTASSLLFEGADGLLYKSGYAPLKDDDEIIGVVVVEGSAQTLKAIAVVRTLLVRLGLVGVGIAVVLALLFSSRIIRPIYRLQRAAENIGQGDYETPVEIKGRDEISFLANTMESMRQGIVQRDTQLKAMLAGVAHEIRNPLGGIELFAGLLNDELTESAEKERAQTILREVHNLKAIVQDFLDYARPALPKRAPYTLHDILKDVLELLREELESKNTKFIWQENEYRILIDPQHAQQIFLNLTKNALQAINRKGKIVVKMEAHIGRVHIFFSDTGTGIPSDVQDHIFEPFFTTRKTGTGLGLAIVKSLTEANGGAITLLKSTDSGSTFDLTFELAEEDSES